MIEPAQVPALAPGGKRSALKSLRPAKKVLLFSTISTLLANILNVRSN
jgi:hypothetical protein